MQINVTDEKILFLTPQLSIQDAENIARSKKADAFGTINKVASFLQRPKDDDFELIYSEQRYQPFWHIVCNAIYEYNRKSTYKWPLKGKEVQSIKINDIQYTAINEHVEVSTIEHCRQEEKQEVFIDAISGDNNKHLAQYLTFTASEAAKEKIHETAGNAIVVPAQIRTSGVIRELMGKIIKGIQADEILEEHVDLNNVDLYYHPIYAFQFKWISKGKEAIVEIDGLTGKVEVGNKLFKQYLGKMVDPDFLFDIGIDAVDLFVPGGGIAAKIARKVIKR